MKIDKKIQTSIEFKEEYQKSKLEEDIEIADKKEKYTSDDLKKYILEISKYKLLSKEEESNLLIKYSLGDEEAGSKIIECNLRLVVSIANKYNLTNCTSIDFVDLIQEGNLALYKALKKFDITKNTRFSTYATWWIKNKIERTIEEQSRSIKVSSYAAENIKKIRRYENKYFMKHNVLPSKKQIMKYLGVSYEEMDAILRTEQNICSLDMAYSEDDSFSLYDVVLNENEEDVSEKASINIDVENILKTMEDILTEKEFIIIVLRVGLIDGKTWTYDSISKKVGVSPQRVRVIEKDALKKVKNRLIYEEKIKKLKRERVK